jgi:hypothetical protein
MSSVADSELWPGSSTQAPVSRRAAAARIHRIGLMVFIITPNAISAWEGREHATWTYIQ